MDETDEFLVSYMLAAEELTKPYAELEGVLKAVGSRQHPIFIN